MHKRVRYLAIVAVIVLGVIAAVAAQNTSPRVIGGDDAALRLLLSHILTSGPYPDKESVANVGQLPDKLPFDLPLPDDIRVVGSVVHGQGSFIQIILE
nr:hypothetical protein [Anaerolineae bacterium]